MYSPLDDFQENSGVVVQWRKFQLQLMINVELHYHLTQAGTAVAQHDFFKTCFFFVFVR